MSGTVVLVLSVVREITSVPQVEGAVKYLKKASEFSLETLREACGAGIVVTENEIDAAVSDQIAAIHVGVRKIIG